jgi:glycerol-3-phosphate dehydrogenase
VLFQKYEDHLVFEFNLSRDISKHLIETYGTSSLRVAALIKEDKKMGERLHEDYPFIKAELLYAIRFEMCEKPNDVICRRVPIAFLNKEVAKGLLPEVTEMMRKEKKWASSKYKEELAEAMKMIEFNK